MKRTRGMAMFGKIRTLICAWQVDHHYQCPAGSYILMASGKILAGEVLTWMAFFPYHRLLQSWLLHDHTQTLIVGVTVLWLRRTLRHWVSYYLGLRMFGGLIGMAKRWAIPRFEHCLVYFSGDILGLMVKIGIVDVTEYFPDWKAWVEI